MFKRLLTAIAMLAVVYPAGALAETQITAVGSTALLPLVKESAAQYQEQHSDVRISVSGGGSYQGIAQAASGVASLGDSDVIAPGNSGLTDHKVAVVGFAIIANPVGARKQSHGEPNPRNLFGSHYQLEKRGRCRSRHRPDQPAARFGDTLGLHRHDHGRIEDQ